MRDGGECAAGSRKVSCRDQEAGQPRAPCSRRSQRSFRSAGGQGAQASQAVRAYQSPRPAGPPGYVRGQGSILEKGRGGIRKGPGRGWCHRSRVGRGGKDVISAVSGQTDRGSWGTRFPWHPLGSAHGVADGWPWFSDHRSLYSLQGIPGKPGEPGPKGDRVSGGGRSRM